jgi:hypothetical protein
MVMRQKKPLLHRRQHAEAVASMQRSGDHKQNMMRAWATGDGGLRNHWGIKCCTPFNPHGRHASMNFFNIPSTSGSDA